MTTTVFEGLVEDETTDEGEVLPMLTAKVLAEEVILLAMAAVDKGIADIWWMDDDERKDLHNAIEKYLREDLKLASS